MTTMKEAGDSMETAVAEASHSMSETMSKTQEDLNNTIEELTRNRSDSSGSVGFSRVRRDSFSEEAEDDDDDTRRVNVDEAEEVVEQVTEVSLPTRNTDGIGGWAKQFQAAVTGIKVLTLISVTCQFMSITLRYA